MNIEQARHQLREATAALAAAEREQAVMDSFGEVRTQWAVMAKVPEFGQWVGFPNEGILRAVFESHEEAERFADEVPPIPNTMNVVESVTLYIK